jgi:protein-S-isoprenylcysteine O-methyltransferase Ste14
VTRRPRILPPVYLLATVIVMLGLHYAVPVRQLFTGTSRWLGLIPVAVGLAFGVPAVGAFRVRKTTIKPGGVSTSLVTSGPFRFSRNPMYVGMVLTLIGLAIGLGSLSPWFAIPLFAAAIATRIIPVEEAMLAEAFGQPYRDYRQRVRRWI